MKYFESINFDKRRLHLMATAKKVVKKAAKKVVKKAAPKKK